MDDDAAGDQYQYHYQIEIESWVQAMSRAAHFRVFHDRTAPEILEDLFSHYPTASYRMELSRDYPTHATMFQYRETDLNFAQRLMEHVGIYYHWEHSERGHVLVLRDSNAVAGSKPKTALKVADLGRRAADGVTRCKLQFPWVTGEGARMYLWGVVDPTLELNKGDYVSAVFVDGSPAQPVVTAIVRSNARALSRR